MSSDTTTNNFMVQVTQQYYTVSAAHPARPDAFFAADVTPADLKNTTGPDNPPAFVSSITYGRTREDLHALAVPVWPAAVPPIVVVHVDAALVDVIIFDPAGVGAGFFHV